LWSKASDFIMNEKMRVDLAELLPIIEEQLSQGKEVCFSPNGVSMLPMLRPGMDSVVLKAPPEKLKKYDLPLYRRENGQFVMHRVVAVRKDGYVMCGDNQYYRERGVGHQQVIGIVVRFTRNGKEYSCRNLQYRIYAWARVCERFWFGKLYTLWKKIKKK